MKFKYKLENNPPPKKNEKFFFGKLVSLQDSFF